MNPTPSPEAVEAAKAVRQYLMNGIDIAESVPEIIDLACRAYAARQNAELRKALEQISGPTTTHIAQARKIATAALKRDEAL